MEINTNPVMVCELQVKEYRWDLSSAALWMLSRASLQTEQHSAERVDIVGLPLASKLIVPH